MKHDLSELRARLPELEWLLNKISPFLLSQQLPNALFRSQKAQTSCGYIQEIREDLELLSKRQDEGTGLYLARLIERKISILVSICHENTRKKNPVVQSPFNIDAIMTRKAYFESLETKHRTLTAQQQALQQILAKKKHQGSTEAILAIQAELGEVQRQLVLNQEAMDAVRMA